MALALALLATMATPAAGDTAPRPRATFVIAVGVNEGPSDLPSLRYADDDAAQYLVLFRALGARAYVLARLDENSARVHPQAAAEALPPTRAQLDRVVAQLRHDVALARGRGVETVLYFIYAGHGDLRDGRAVLDLEGSRLGGEELLEDVVGRVGADRSHVIVDACYSSFLLQGRGPGGRRRPVAGFSRLGLPVAPPGVGLLLSSSSGRDAHEWEGIQAGVFSHEVRSGLYGAADANGDGLVSYREIAAFVTRANDAIPNERFRPDVFALPPEGSGTLVDLRPGLDRRVVVEAAGHYILEDGNGVRVLEMNGAATFVRPGGERSLYLVRVPDGTEFALPAQPVVALSTIAPVPQTTRARGAAHESFARLFTLRFDQEIVARYRQQPLDPVPLDGPRLSVRRRAGVWSAGAGAAALLGALGTTYAASAVHDGASAGASHVDVVARNVKIRRLNIASGVLYSVAGVAAAGGALLLLWPETPARVGVEPGGITVGVELPF